MRPRLSHAVLIVSCSFIFLLAPAVSSAATGAPNILSYQGRLLNASGDLLGSSSGTNYCFRTSIYDASSAGSKLWPSGTPSTATAQVKSGVFTLLVGDSTNGDALDYDFQTSDSIYLNIEVAAQVSSSCNGVTFETLSPRHRIVSSGYAINANTLNGLSSSSFIRTSTTTLPGITTLLGLTNASTTNLTVTATASTTNLIVSGLGGDSIRCLQVGTDGTVSANASGCGGAGGSPGGADTQIQFNNSGSFGGSANLTWNGTKLFASQASTTLLTVSSTASTTNLIVSGAVTFPASSLLASVISDFDSSVNAYIHASTTILKNYTFNDIFDSRLSATTTLPNLTTLLGLTDLISTRSTSTYATSTNFAAINASTTNLTVSGVLTALQNIVGNVTGNITGNADTATALETPRTINGTSFNGTANITITAASSSLLADVNTWTGLQTISYASTTMITATTASTTNLIVSGLTQGECVQTTTGGLFTTTGSACGSGGATTLDSLTNVTVPSPSHGHVLSFDSADSTWKNIATSTLKIAVSDLVGDTDSLSQGSTNRYYTDSLVNAYIHSSTTIVKNYTFNDLFDSRLAATTTLPNLTHLLGLTNASTSALSITGLATPAGTFLAVDASGLVIATTTPAIGGSGTVTSVGLSVPTGFTAGSAVTTSGTLALSFDTGYSLPTTVSQTSWSNKWDLSSTTIGVAYGGTGQTSFGVGEVLYASGATTLTSTSTANLKTTLGLNSVENTALSTWAGTSNILTVGALNAGSITSGFGSIDLGDDTFTTSGLASLGTLLLSGSTTLQNFTFANATGTNATTTNFASTNASTTNLIVSGNLTALQTITGSISGNAGTVTGGVYTGDAGTVFLAPNGSGAALTGLTKSQMSDFDDSVNAYIHASTTIVKNYTFGDIFDSRLSATSTLPNLTTLLGLTNATSTMFTVSNTLYLPKNSATVGSLYVDNQRFLNTYGTDNIFLGQNSGNLTNINGGSIGIGKNSLSSLSTGIWNVAVGNDALAVNTSGSQSVAIGFSALTLNTTGGENTAVGAGASSFNTTGSKNSSFGDNSLSKNTVGLENTGVGYNALSESTTGNYNTALGAYAGSAAEGTLFSQTGNYNLFLGYNASQGNSYANVLSNSIAIGSYSAVSTSNSMVLGGTGEYAVSVGISTSTPYSKLSIWSNGTNTGARVFEITDQASTTVFYINDQGVASTTNLVVSGWATTSALAITGNATSTGTNGIDLTAGCFSINGTCVGGGGSGASLTVANTWTELQQFNGNASTSRLSVLDYFAVGNSSASTTINSSGDLLVVGSTTLQNVTMVNATTSSLSVAGIASVGSLGIGSSSPFTAFDVVGSGYFSQGLGLGVVNGNETGIYMNNGIIRNKLEQRFIISAELYQSELVLKASDQEVVSIFGHDSIPLVGIGTTTPISTLNVVGNNAGGTKITLTDYNAVENKKHWFMESIAGVFNLGTTSDSQVVTDTFRPLSVSSQGFGTTTLSGLTISGYATSTSNVGFNITTGCYAVSGVCVGGAGGGAGTVTSVTAGTGLSGGEITSSGTITLNMASINSWTGLQSFTNANFTMATTSQLLVNGSSTIYRLDVTDNSATTTLAGGLNVRNDTLIVENATGNVGIGTAPVYKLTVGGSILAKGLELTGEQTSPADGPGFYVSGSSAFLQAGSGNNFVITRTTPDNPILTAVTGSGNVGIGTSTPNGKLGIFGDISAGSLPTIELSGADGPDYKWTMGVLPLAGGGKFVIASSSDITVDATHRLVIDGNGNVGVGTSNPQARLHVGGTLNTDGLATVGSLAISDVGALGVVPFVNDAGLITADQGMMMWTNLDTIPRLGIGTTTPWASVSINGLGGGLQTTPLFVVATSTVDSWASTTAFIIDQNGKVGIGTDVPSTQLTIQGTASTTNLIVSGSLTLSSAATGGMIPFTQTGGTIAAVAGFNFNASNGILTVSKIALSNATSTGTIFANVFSGNSLSIGGSSTTTISGNGGTSIFNSNVNIGTSTGYSKFTIWGQATSTEPAQRIFEVTDNASTTLFSIDTSGTTTISNLALGEMLFETDAGAISWADMPSATTTAGMVLSYSAQIAGTPILTVYGQSAGTGAVQNWGIGVGTTSPGFRFAVCDTVGTTCSYSSGGGWTSASDRNLKENFVELDNQEILRKITELSVTKWNYKMDNASSTHIGPMAQDFHALFQLEGGENFISTIDPAGIALVGIKALASRLGDMTDKWSLDNEGLLVVESLEVKGNVKIGSPEKRSGITLYDEVTGEPYCLKISNGTTVSTAGVCGTQSTTNSSNVTSPSTEVSPSTTPASPAGEQADHQSAGEGETSVVPESTEDLSTTTPAVESEPVVEAVPEPVVEPVIEPISEPEPVTEQVVEPVVEPTPEPEPATEPVAEPATPPADETAEPVTP